MAGIYIHIPFCAKACHYCNFHFSTHISRKPQMVQTIAQHIAKPILPAGVIPERNVETIYFGGGTPSLLSAEELLALISAVRQKFEVAPDAEITLEANPDDISPLRLQQWQQLGINRLSIGVQSFQNNHLQWMNRAHNNEQALQSIAWATQFGFHNFSIDLIYGLPDMDEQAWQANLEQAIALGVPHISSYALTVEEKTALHHFIAKGKVAAPDDDMQARHFDIMTNSLQAAGFLHYEISNFAKPGLQSRHNSNYWSGNAYYGFGPGAHSFDGHATRWWYKANNALYIAQANHADAILTTEKLTETERLNEKIMTGLRQQQGIPVSEEMQMVAGTKMRAHHFATFMKSTETMQSQGLLIYADGILRLAAEAKFLADGIAAKLFVSE